MSLQDFYDGKANEYFSNVRGEVVEPIPLGNNRVLELGCGDGATGLAIKVSGKASEVVGVEISPQAAIIAESRLDQVLVGNIEEMSLPFPEGYFDFLIAADVLEHLVDPWTLLRRVAPLLSDNGVVIASIPNVRNWRVVAGLFVRGRWEYTESGILDRTHLRFFTRTSMVELVEQAGFAVSSVSSLGQRSRKVSRWLPRAARDFATPQYLLVAKRCPV